MAEPRDFDGRYLIRSIKWLVRDVHFKVKETPAISRSGMISLAALSCPIIHMQ